MGIIITVLEALAVGLMVGVILWGYPHPEEWSAQKKRKITTMVTITTIVTGGACFWIAAQISLSPSILEFAALMAMQISLLRLIRLVFIKSISKKNLNIFSLFDFLVGGVLLVLLGLWLRAMATGRYLSMENALGFPVIYILTCLYAIANVSQLRTSRLKLAAWRLVSYAFPQGQEHRKGKIGKSQNHGLTVTDILGWSLFMGFFYGNGLLAYRLSEYAVIAMIYLGVILISFAVFVAAGGFRKAKPRKIGTIIAGSGLVCIFGSLIIILGYGGVIDTAILKIRVLLSFVLGIPGMLFAVDFFPPLPAKIWNRWKEFSKENQTLEQIRSVTDSVRLSAFGQKSTATLQAFAISFVFFIYYVLPKTAPLLKMAGIDAIAGTPIEKLIEKFETIALSWSMPKTLTGEELLSFLLGNQGFNPFIDCSVAYFPSVSFFRRSNPARHTSLF